MPRSFGNLKKKCWDERIKINSTVNHEAGDFNADLPQLCIALNCLPSQLRKESYNDIENILAVFAAEKKRMKRLTKKK